MRVWCNAHELQELYLLCCKSYSMSRSDGFPLLRNPFKRSLMHNRQHRLHARIALSGA
jgi:hypothetical protein